MNHWKTQQQIKAENPNMVSLPDLTDEEQEFAERFSRQLHLYWGVTRLARGFSFGEERTETTHPNLVNFSSLPVDQQEFDLEDAITTMRVLKGMGLQFQNLHLEES